MSIEQIALHFSTGQFEKVYACFSENITWNIIGENYLAGKKAVMENCEQVAAYFKTVQTDFKTTGIISKKNRVAIEGSAEFIKDGKTVAFVWACDTYEFTEDNKLQIINSYCIPKK